jgi:hypothetical protein
MPPCAATVWLRVGNTLVMQAVLEALFGHAEGRAQARAAGADHDHVVFVIDETANHTVSGTSATALRRCPHQCSVPELAEPSPNALPSGDLKLMPHLPSAQHPRKPV